MKIKKNSYHVFCFSIFFGVVLIILISFSFFLGFEITKHSLIGYLATILCTVALCVLVGALCNGICKTYYIFLNDSFAISADDQTTILFSYSKIKHIEYYRFYHLLLGNSKGGKLIISYVNESAQEELIMISFSPKKIKKIPFSNVTIK